MFWRDLIRSSKPWGLITYEQDWLINEFDNMDVIRSMLFRSMAVKPSVYCLTDYAHQRNDCTRLVNGNGSRGSGK